MSLGCRYIENRELRPCCQLPVLAGINTLEIRKFLQQAQFNGSLKHQGCKIVPGGAVGIAVVQQTIIQ